MLEVIKSKSMIGVFILILMAAYIGPNCTSTLKTESKSDLLMVNIEN